MPYRSDLVPVKLMIEPAQKDALRLEAERREVSMQTLLRQQIENITGTGTTVNTYHRVRVPEPA